MTAAIKGHFIHRSPNPRQQPSTIYISDGRNVIYLETGGRYKGKFVPIESAKMPPLSEMDSLPIGKTYSGIIIDGNIVSEIASVLRDSSYEVVAPSLGLVGDITYSAPFNPKQEWDMLIGQPIAFGEPTGIPSIDRKYKLSRKANWGKPPRKIELSEVSGRTIFNRAEKKYVLSTLSGVNDYIEKGSARSARWWVNGVINDFGQFVKVESGEWDVDYLDNLAKHYLEHKKNGLRMSVIHEMFKKLQEILKHI